MRTTKWLTVAVTLLFMCLAVGCGGNKKVADTTESGEKRAVGKIMIYSSIYPDIIDDVCKPKLKKAFPDMQVSWFQGGTEKVVAKIAGEIKANRVGADLLMVADPSYYLKLQKRKRFLNYVSPNFKNVITAKDKDGAWTSVRISNMIIAYNADKMKAEDAPKSWKDLTNPKWKGRIAMPNPLLSGTAFVAVGALADKYGWGYFDQLKANGIHIEQGNSAIQNKLLTGEYAVAMILEENILKLRETKKENLKVIYPTDGCIIIPSPIAIMSTTTNPDGARSAVDWWLSKEGQQAVVKGWMYSVRTDVAPPHGAPALQTLLGNAVKVNWQKLADENAQIKEAFRVRVME